MAKLRIVFMGTAELACPILRALHSQSDFEIAAVVTQPDRPQGRNLEVQGSAVKRVALSAGLPVLQPERARDAQFLIIRGPVPPGVTQGFRQIKEYPLPYAGPLRLYEQA